MYLGSIGLVQINSIHFKPNQIKKNNIEGHVRYRVRVWAFLFGQFYVTEAIGLDISQQGSGKFDRHDLGSSWRIES